MTKEKVLMNFPEAFQPLVVVIGDRREDPPKSMADLLAYSISSTDVLFLQHLNLGKVDTLSDKVFVHEDLETLERKYGDKNLLVIGSPAVNLLARKINDKSLFHFNISEEAKEKLARQEKILDEIKFDQEALQIYLEIMLGATTPDEILLKFQYLPALDKKLEEKCIRLLAEHKSTGLKKRKDLIHEFDRPGIKDLIDNTIHGQSPKPHLDYGLISIAHNPFSKDGRHVAVYVAGVHGPGTTHCVKLLADKSAFQKHPYGGVIEIEINIFRGWTERLYEAKASWQTSPYEEKDPRVPNEFIRIIYSSQDPYREKKTFISSPYDEKDINQKSFNSTIVQAFKKFHENEGLKPVCHEPFSLELVGPLFEKEIVKRFRKADYIIHDITEFSRGVLYEVGVSLGLRKYFFLIWDSSRANFDAQNLPELLQEINVIQINYNQKKEVKKTLKNNIFSPGINLTGNCHCYLDEDEKEPIKCNEDEKKGKKTTKERAYVIVPSQLTKIRKHIAEILREYNILVLRDTELPAKNTISKTCCGIKKAEYCFVEISENYLDGIITLGFCRGMGKINSTLMLYREGIDGNVLPMWPGKRCEWSDDSWQQDVEKNIRELVEGVRTRSKNS